jgi:hypothetical protein
MDTKRIGHYSEAFEGLGITDGTKKFVQIDGL